jgi:phage terminase Nu1 subunit (DNA packaging protein)
MNQPKTNKTQTLVTHVELEALLGVSQRTVDRWRRECLLTEPIRAGRLLFDLATVRADVLRHRLRVRPEFLEATTTTES